MAGISHLGDPISHGGNIITASSDVFCDGLPVARVTDMVDCKAHGPNQIISGASTTFTNGLQTARIGDKTACGAELMAGPSRDIGDGSTSVAVIPSAAFTKPADKPVKMNAATEAKNATQLVAYINNPSAFANPLASANGVQDNYAGTPDTTGQVDTEPPKKCVNGHDATVLPFLKKILSEAGNGQWSKSGMGGNPSNPNIIGIWKSLGYPTASGIFSSDQTAWCAGFVNFALKESGLPYLKEAGARNTISRGPSINMKPVAIADMQPGDIVLWSFSHVNFCYTASNGRFTFVGGNQKSHGAQDSNNPSNSTVSQSWISGWTTGKGQIAAVMRPSCT